jgi:hypothetical protein
MYTLNPVEVEGGKIATTVKETNVTADKKQE